MSEQTPVAPVQETPIADTVPETKIEEAAPANTETAAITEPTPVNESTPAAAETAAVVPETESAEKEFSGEGVLGYKAPGGFLKKLAGFQKKYFWFGDEAVDPKHLSSYLRGEKAEVANHNAAWSSHTGKGLLYFSKHSSEKATPAGIINLSEVTDVTEEGILDFFFHAHGQKHVFQAASQAERDSWVAAIKAKSVEAKGSVEVVTGSEKYKEQHSALSKPSVAAAASAQKTEAKEEKKEDKAEAKEDKEEDKAEAKEKKKEEKAAAKEDKLEVKDKSRKSRSASRKRTSIFGGFGIGSKKEEVKEISPAESPIESAEADAATEAAPLDGPAVAAAVVAAPVSEEPSAAETAPVETTRPIPTKRSSVFGSLSSRFASKKPVSDDAPAVPAKDGDAAEVGVDAPVIPKPEATEPLATSIDAPATNPVEATAVTEGTATGEEVKDSKPTPKADKRKSSLPFGFGTKKERTPSDSETEKSKSPFAKLRQTVKGKTSPKVSEKAVPAEEDKVPEPVVENGADSAASEPVAEPAASEPAAEPAAAAGDSEVVSEPAPVATNAPQVSATA